MKAAFFGVWYDNHPLYKALKNAGVLVAQTNTISELSSFDVVFFNSEYPSQIPNLKNFIFLFKLTPHFKKLASEILKTSPNSKVVFYKSSHDDYQEVANSLLSSDNERIFYSDKKATKLPTKHLTKAAFLVLLVLLIFTLPFMLLAVSIGSGASGVYLTTQKNKLSNLGAPLFSLSQSSASLSYDIFHFEKNDYFASISLLSRDAASVLNNAIVAQKVGHDFLSSLLSQSKSAHSPQISQNLATKLLDTYRDASFWKINSDKVLGASTSPQISNLFTYLQVIPTVIPFLENSDTLLGQNSPITYLLLFQNNMELRPTGGFIGSFALVTVDRAKMTNKEVYDVYDADGQLAGFVSPPDPIKKYLGEAAWHMRDANWDPDFTVTAKRILWFLDKTMDRKADIVIGLDLSTVKSILSVLGPTTLPGYGETVTAENVYKLAEAHAENNFFPGTNAKKTYLATLAETLLSNISSSDSDTQKKLLLALFTQLNNRSIQIASDRADLASSFHSVSWDGSYEAKPCGDSCLPIISSINEANLGVNKANLSVSRSISTKITKEADNSLKINTNLHLVHDGKYSNNGNESYKVYVRNVAPIGATFENTRIFSANSLTILPTEVKETNLYSSGGVFIEVLPNSSVDITFSYLINVESNKFVQLQWIKQSGVVPYPFTLTDIAGHVYNTSLEASFAQSIDLK